LSCAEKISLKNIFILAQAFYNSGMMTEPCQQLLADNQDNDSK